MVVVLPPKVEAASSITQTTLPPAFGTDVGPAKWSFSAAKFSWASGTSNMTLGFPTLTVVVGSTSCSVALKMSAFSHNSTAYKWAFVAANAVNNCNGGSVNPTIYLYVVNVTGVYNQKEIILVGKTVKTGTSTIVNKIGFGVASPSAISGACSKCYSVSVGTVAFNWGQLSSNSPSYSNTTSTLTVSSASSTSATTTYIFDPVALDGSSYGELNTAKTTTCTLSTSSANGIVMVTMVGTIPNSGSDSFAVSDTSTLTWTNRMTSPTKVLGGSLYGQATEFYAKAPSALTNDVITFTVTGSSVAAGLVACFGVSGASQTSILDPNSALAIGTNGSTSPYAITFSTTNPQDLVFGQMLEMGGAGITNPSGWTDMINQVVFPRSSDVAYKLVSVAQSSVTATWTSDPSNHFIGFIDAIEQLATIDTVTLTVSPVGGTAGTFTLSGGSVTPSSISGDGSPHSITCALGSPTVTITVPAAGSNSRQVFTNDGQTQTFTCGGAGHSFTYYSQQSFTADYSGAVPPGGAPSFSGTQYGTPATVTLLTTSPVTLWYDFQTPYFITKPAADFPVAGERYDTGFANGSVNAGATVNPAFYHQFSQVLLITIACRQSATCTTLPSLQYTSFGSLWVGTATNSSTVWPDSGSSLSVSSTVSDFQGNSYTTSPSSWTVTGSNVVTNPMAYTLMSGGSQGGGGGGGGQGYNGAPTPTTSSATVPAPIPSSQFGIVVVAILSVFALTGVVAVRGKIESDADKLSRQIGSPVSLGRFSLGRPKKKNADKRVSSEVGRLVSLTQMDLKKVPSVPDAARKVSEGIGKGVSLKSINVRRRHKGES